MARSRYEARGGARVEKLPLGSEYASGQTSPVGGWFKFNETVIHCRATHKLPLLDGDSVVWRLVYIGSEKQRPTAAMIERASKPKRSLIERAADRVERFAAEHPRVTNAVVTIASAAASPRPAAPVTQPAATLNSDDKAKGVT